MRTDAKSSSGDDAARILRRAEEALDALRERHLRRLGHVVPGTRIGAPAWPPAGRFGSRRRLTASWNYWWQAHLVDLLADAAARGDRRAAGEARALLRGIRIRNAGRWRNDYYDDMAWLALAVERLDRHSAPPALLRHERAQRLFTGVFTDAWAPELGGGIPWRVTDHFFNVPANGPAGIFLARRGRLERAAQMSDWIAATMLLPSGLIADGEWLEADGSRRMVRNVYTYCQGVTLGLDLELYRSTGQERFLNRMTALVAAVAGQLTTDGVIRGGGGGDGGLFAGILARYLALIATDLPETAPGGEALRRQAASLVLASAEAAWEGRAEVAGRPLFAADWSRPAVIPDAAGAAGRFDGGAVGSSAVPERDLSVQLSAAMVLSAAASVTARSPEHTDTVTPD
ncbi:glycoside hydrolase family 76 protein [Gordonia sp. VNK21]|uniref:glycoside hydrolase family 76 protein n=1 Tax=Gordonia sp. VNK21 TaxID=3382483 RepID=UPI0038D37F9D